jgi:hypothetical protein
MRLFFDELSGMDSASCVSTAVSPFRPTTIVAESIALVVDNTTLDGESMKALLHSSRNVLQATTKTRPFFLG